jgi:hypothetical protein
MENEHPEIIIKKIAIPHQPWWQYKFHQYTNTRPSSRSLLLQTKRVRQQSGIGSNTKNSALYFDLESYMTAIIK